tara:strand:- start:20 stop:1399 length:1380 start_codon:yes stop_codon:yes gene_type:complete
LNEEDDLFTKLWGYIKSAKNLTNWETYGDDYTKIELGTVSETVSVMIDVKKKQDEASETYKDDKLKLKLAKEQIAEQGKTTSKKIRDGADNEVKLLDETYEQKYGEIIDAHKATKSYLKANGKVIALYKRDMAIINQKMKAAKVLGLDEEWQKEQVQILKDKNKQRIAELNDKKKKAQESALDAEDQKEAAEAIEKAVPAFKGLEKAMANMDKEAGAIFYTEEEYKKITSSANESKLNEVEAPPAAKTSRTKDDVKEKKYVKNLSKLTNNKKLQKELDGLVSDDDKKARIKEALNAFMKGLKSYEAAAAKVDEIKQEVGEAIDAMPEFERPKGSSGMIKWKDIEIMDTGGDSELMKEVEEKIKMTGQKDVKPGDILKAAAGETKNPEVEKLEKEIGDLTGEKEKLQKQIKDLESKEAQPPEENKEEKKVEEIKKLKNDIDTFKAQKEELQTRIEELQAA